MFHTYRYTVNSRLSKENEGYLWLKMYSHCIRLAHSNAKSEGMKASKLRLSLKDRQDLESFLDKDIWMQCGVELVTSDASPDEAVSSYVDGFFLHQEESKQWLLKDLSEPRWRPLMVSFETSDWKLRIRRTWNSKELLRDALGAKRGEVLKIVDGTAGLGADAFMMALWGHEVLAFEKNPLLAFLLSAAIESFLNSDAEEKPHLKCVADAFACSKLEIDPLVDVLYLDPIYPEKKKVALNKKELRIVKKLVGPAELSDDELTVLILECLPSVRRRVVVKRPSWSPRLEFAGNAVRSVEGKSTRFDIFDRSLLPPV